VGWSSVADGFPLVAFASTVQFAPDETSSYPHVESRMLLAGVSGAGSVTVNGETVDVRPGTIVVMPWGHAVRYQPHPRDPYLVYGAHLIPWHSAAAPIDLAVPHHRDHALTGSASRSDRELAIGPGLWVSDEGSHPTLRSVIRLAAEIWDRGTPSRDTAMALGLLVVNELQTVSAALPHDDRNLPVTLRRVLAWINAEPGRPITLDQLAEVAGASPTTITRLFRRHLATSPLAWVLQTRMEAAKVLLTTTALPVNQVARRCGFGDPYYFSRRFSRVTGLSPSTWRRQWSAP
jgi:AraC-like DNA-binding protein